MKSLNNLYILSGIVFIMGVLVMDLMSIEYFLQSAHCIQDSTDIEHPSTETEEKLVDPGLSTLSKCILIISTIGGLKVLSLVEYEFVLDLEIKELLILLKWG
jgi:hypothetical protein